MLAIATGLRGRVEPINLDQGSPVPFGFIFQLSDKLTPSDVTDSFCKAVVLDHVLDGQTLDAYHLVFVDDAGRELVLVVPSAVIDPSVDFGNFQTSFVSVLRSLFLLGMPSLCFGKLLLILGKIAGIAYTLTSRESHHGLYAKIETDHVGGHWQWLDIVFYQDGNEVAVGTILRDRDRTGLAAFGQRPMPVNIQRRIYLGKCEVLPIPLERIGGIGSRLLVLLFLESRILGAALKKVLEGPVQMPQRLLNRHRGDFTQPRVLLLEIRQHGCKVVIGELLTTLFVSRLASLEPPIVDETDTSKRLSQVDPVPIGRIEAILVCPLGLAHSLLAFLVFLDMLFHCGQDLPIQRAIIAFCNLFQLLQDMSGKPQGECFSIAFHSTIIQSIWLNVNRLRYTLPQPQTRNGALIPRLKDCLLPTFLGDCLQRGAILLRL
jgi:hypothetical protein